MIQSIPTTRSTHQHAAPNRLRRSHPCTTRIENTTKQIHAASGAAEEHERAHTRRRLENYAGVFAGLGTLAHQIAALPLPHIVAGEAYVGVFHAAAVIWVVECPSAPTHPMLGTQ